MQYYIKIFNKTTGDLVGYYKETGRNCISKMMNGIKYFNDYNEALRISDGMDEGFIRDKDKKYYTAHSIVYGDASRKRPDEIKKTKKEKEEELKDELEAFIRKNSSRVE